MKPLYETTMINVGGREGKVHAPDNSFQLDITKPEKTDTGTNPEQLFAAGYSSCFNGALELMLKKGKVEYNETQVTAHVALYKDEADNGFQLGVKLEVEIDGVDKETAQEYAEKAHAFCPYSKALKGNVNVELSVK